MGDVHNGHVLRLQILDDAEQGLHLVLCQRRGGLVQDQHPAVCGNGLGNLHRLHLRYAELPQFLFGVKVHPDLFQQLGGVGIHFVMVNHGNDAKKLFHGIPSQENILAHGSCGDGLKFLVHHGDAFFQGVHGVTDADGLSVNLDLALIHFVDAKHALHQCGFSRAVFSHQRVNFSGMKLQLGMIQCFHAWK